ncbi:MAG TPA: DUF4476 domain-containing protein [Flavipsychrobacter sp.]|nr:DUF4476 domain-containing protein [Flavipsychrobacter sp.]
MKLVKYFFVLLSLLVFADANAQDWSYVYIQGDKQIPFYVKLEGEMLPRYSKNYYIIPQLAAGAIQLQVLFQQNEYQPQNFKVLVPENGHRGFLLTKKDGAFALYDIQQKFYLMPAGVGEDRLPEVVAKNTIQSGAATEEKSMLDQAFKNNPNDPKFLNNVVLENERPAPQEVTSPATPVIEQPVQQTTPPVAEPETTLVTEEPTIEEEPIATQEEPTVVNNQNTVIEEPVSSEPENIAPVETTPTTPLEPEQTTSLNTIPEQIVTTPPVSFPAAPATREVTVKQQANPECPEPISQGEFDKLYSSTKNREDDESRISYLMKIAKSNCYSTQQIYFLTREIQAESMRYSFLKKVFPKVTDQYNFRQLEDHLFKTLEWKSYFRLIYQ